VFGYTGDVTAATEPHLTRVQLQTTALTEGAIRRLSVTLRSLKHALPVSDTLTLNLALLNVRSVSNKTLFLLNDLFIARSLDFMFLTETWLREGDFTPLSELLPPGCNYFNSPRITGKGGGLTSIFKSTFCCQQSSTAGYSSFELQLFEVKLSETFLCAVIYRPPKFNKDFARTDLWSKIL